MQRPSFGVVTGVVLVLAALSFAAHTLLGYIPAGPENRLAAESADFLKRASHEQIDWRLLDDSLFSEARRRDKPIMLLVGTVCNAKGRDADSQVFASKDLRAYLARHFLCARVDSMARPELASCFLPVSRALISSDVHIAVTPDFQIWFLDPGGNLFAFASSSAIGRQFDDRNLLGDAQDANSRFGEIQAGRAKSGVEQRRDLSSLEAIFPEELPNLPRYADFLQDATSKNGGFPVNGVQRLWPLAWRLQLLARRPEAYSKSMEPCLKSPVTDLIEGGFFTGSSSIEWREMSYDKLATVNAEMAETLALAALVTQSAPQRWIAQRTLGCLLDQFVKDGYLRAGQIGDEDRTGRSARLSFSPKELRDRFGDPADREWLRDNLGMRVESNRQMTPMLMSLDLPQRAPKRFQAVLETFRKDLKDPDFASGGYLDAGAYACARILGAARLLGDIDAIERARTLFDRLDSLRTLDDVVHAAALDSPGHASLSDYLAYSDGALHCFLCTGNDSYLDRGASVLRRALLLFRGKAKGEYAVGRGQGPGGIRDAAAPEIVDPGPESSSAQVMRLCNDYGRLLGRHGTDLIAVATEVQSRFAPVAPLLGQFAAGYYSAAADVIDPPWAIVVGPNAVLEANRLAPKIPDRLVAPASAAVRPDLKRPGIYVVRPVETLGPLTESEAVKSLARTPF